MGECLVLRKVVLVVAVVVLVFSGCAGENPPESGYVRNKDFIPAHWEGGYRYESYMDCGPHLNYDGDIEFSCKPATRSVYESHHTWVDDTWKLFLEDCEPPDEKGKEHCNKGWLEVTETMYNEHSLNSHYPDAR